MSVLTRSSSLQSDETQAVILHRRSDISVWKLRAHMTLLTGPDRTLRLIYRYHSVLVYSCLSIPFIHSEQRSCLCVCLSVNKTDEELLYWQTKETDRRRVLMLTAIPLTNNN